MPATTPAPRADLRLADLLAALSLETDLGMGSPPEEAMRTCLLATLLAQRVDLPVAEISDVYWTALLMHVGCTAYAHEQAALFGVDEIAMNVVGAKTDFANARDALSALLELGRGAGPLSRARILFVGLTRGKRFDHDIATATCEVAAGMARRLGLPDSVQRAMADLFERWDGKGEPRGVAAEAIARPARAAQLAAQTMVYYRLGGVDAALDVAAQRAGTALDPELAGALARHGRDLFGILDAQDPWTAVLDAEPAPQRRIADAGIDDVARAFADAVDLKSPFTLGHSSAVAELAAAAGRALGLPEDDVVALRRAALLHDLGRVAVSNEIWEKDGPLTAGEWEQVRLHAYHSERILSRSSVLAPLAPLAGMHHERLDGSGYHRQATAAALPMTARVLAAADAFQAMTQARAHRPALARDAAAEQLDKDARAGRLDARAVDAILAAAGESPARPTRQGWPAGLTDREVEVLALIARGLSNREVGRRLFISPRTVGRHVEHIYQKLAVSSRAAAAMFAAQHDLL